MPKQQQVTLVKMKRKLLKETKSWDDKVVRVQDKGFRFVMLESEIYEQKVQQQINRTSFKE